MKKPEKNVTKPELIRTKIHMVFKWF